MIIEQLFLGLSVFYGSIICFFFIGIIREKRRQERQDSYQPTVSVVVPARNEAAAITQTLESLAAQDYPREKLEILIVDDHSRDNTDVIVEQFIENSTEKNFRLIRHRTNGEKPTFKKTAIAYALQFASGEIIMTTDADCEVQPSWVTSMISRFDENTGLVAGLIAFGKPHEKTLFHKLQTLEYAGLVFCGVGAIGNNYPIICNGSNLSYRRAAFDAIGGFEGHEHIPSGDDDLFMQNLHRYTDWKVRYNLHPDSINYTRPVDTFKQFMNQRARWASKGSHYPGVKTFLLLLLIYLFYLMLLLLIPVTLLGYFSGKLFLTGLGLKLLPELMIIYQSLAIFQRKDLLPLALLGEAAQIPYIVYAGFAGFFNLFKWK